MAHIYIIRNSENKKVYIGQTLNSIEHRFSKHLAQRNCKTRCSALCAAFNKYGIHKFKIESLTSGDYTKKELDLLEQFYIAHYQSISPKGYNIQSGGSQFKMSLDYSIRKSKSLKGRKITWKDKVSEGMKRKWADPQYRNKMRNAHKGKRGYKYKPHSKPLRLKLDNNEIKTMYKSGMTIWAICKRLKVSFDVIKRRI